MWLAAGPVRIPAAFTRSAFWLERTRANTASVIPVSGTPSSRADSLVQRPVPFCSASSSITSTRAPFAKDRGELGRSETERRAQQVVTLGDQLDVRVFDPVVHHFHEVPRAVRADIRAARHAIDLGRDRVQHLLDMFVGLARTAWHQAWAEQRALLPTGHAHAQKAKARPRSSGRSAPRVVEQRITTVDERVAGLEQHGERIDAVIDRRAGFDHEQDRPWWREDVDQLLESGRGFEVPFSPI